MMMISCYFLFLSFPFLVEGFGGDCYLIADNYLNGNIKAGPDYPVPPNLKIAMAGDNVSEKELQLILSEGAEVLLQAGDSDYKSNPPLYKSMLDAVLPSDFPYYHAIGNHDVPAYQGYSQMFLDRMRAHSPNPLDLECIGDVGVNLLCSYKGLLLLQSAVGSCSFSNESHAEYIDNMFSQYGAVWKIVTIHKNQHFYQVGNNGDLTGYAVLETARQHGAMIHEGHEHSFCRTYQMSSFEQFLYNNSTMGFNPTLSPGPGTTGTTFLFVSGLGGQDIRHYSTQTPGLYLLPWMASTASLDGCTGYCRQNGGESIATDFAVMFCTFNVNGQMDKAHCYYKDVKGRVFDSFDVTSTNPPTPTAKADISCVKPWVEVIVTNSDDDVALAMDGSISMRKRVISDKILRLNAESSIQLTFRDIKLRTPLVQAWLQVYGVELGWGHPNITIRGVVDEVEGVTTNAVAMWLGDNSDGWEKDTVWTCEITSVITELIEATVTSTPSFVLLIESSGVWAETRFFYSFDHAAHMSPTLAMEFESPC